MLNIHNNPKPATEITESGRVMFLSVNSVISVAKGFR
jgi:hypothetical protein